MRSNSIFIPLPREQMPDWLLALRNGFLASLVSLGLKITTVKNYACAIDWLCVEAGHRGLILPDGVDEATFGLIRDPLPARLSDYSRQLWTYALDRFIAHLVNEGAIAAVPQLAPVPTALDTLCTDYGTWLRTQRGSAPSTVKMRQGQLRNFLTFRFGNAAPGDLNVITQANIVAYLEATDEAGLAGARSKANSLRSLFRFLFVTGRIDRNLALCVPSIARPRSPAPTRHLSQEEVERVLAAARGDSAIARRNHAMLLTMARLGLRGQEIIAIRLDDIDWQAGEILVRGKGGQQATMPLPVDVGEAMVDWIRYGRRGNSRHLFVHIRPPFLPFASSKPIGVPLRRSYAASGVAPPGGKVRCHVFRHSLAMSLLQGGTSLADIGNLLRHDSAETTTIYARHDIQALRPLARPWPVPQPVSEGGS